MPSDGREGEIVLLGEWTVNDRDSRERASQMAHVAVDGRAVMNHAEWSDVAAYDAALSSRSERSGAAAVVDGASAVRFAGVRRYTRWRSIPAHAAPR